MNACLIIFRVKILETTENRLLEIKKQTEEEFNAEFAFNRKSQENLQQYQKDLSSKRIKFLALFSRDRIKSKFKLFFSIWRKKTISHNLKKKKWKKVWFEIKKNS